MLSEREERKLFLPIQELESILEKSKQAEYLFSYLTSDDIKAKGFVIEDDYVDKDFLIDYANFYARSFKPFNRFTTRLHFFDIEFKDNELKEAIQFNNLLIKEKIKNSYLGFIIKKPISNPEDNPLIGRTILKTYKEKVNGENRIYLMHEYPVSFFGIPLSVNSLPFQVQDPAVGACATTACWVAIHPLAELFGIEKHSPYEVTARSVSFPFPERNFPSEGLSTFQMKYYFNSIGLESEFINPVSVLNECKFYVKGVDDVVSDVVKAYTNIRLPIIALLDLWREPPPGGRLSIDPNDYHASVISGYRHKNGRVTEIYVHDDRIGPYHRVEPVRNFFEWKNDLRKQGFAQIRIDKLLIPIYPKIRLKFGFIYEPYLEFKRSLEKRSNIKEKFDTELLLFDIRQYKEALADKNFDAVGSNERLINKFDFLTKSLPRYIWVIRVLKNDNLYQDYIFDATIVYPETLLTLNYYQTADRST